MFRLQDLNFNDFRVIHLLKKHEHITVVAEKMFMTQPAITHRLKQIEEKLTFKVFNKLGNKFVITNEGLILNDFFTKYKSLLRETSDKINNEYQQVSGVITIGSSDTLALYILPQVIKEFKNKYPNVIIKLTSNPSKIVSKELLSGKIDLGIALTNSLTSNFDIIHLFTRKDVVIVSPQSTLANLKELNLKDLENNNLITLDEESQSRYFILDWFKKRKININIAMELASIEMVKKYVELDYGFSIVPEFSVENEIKHKQLSKILINDDVSFGEIAAFTDKNRYLSTAASAFITMLKDFEF